MYINYLHAAKLTDFIRHISLCAEDNRAEIQITFVVHLRDLAGIGSPTGSGSAAGERRAAPEEAVPDGERRAEACRQGAGEAPPPLLSADGLARP